MSNESDLTSTKKALANDKTGCLATLLFFAILMAFCAGGFVGNDQASDVQKTLDAEDTRDRLLGLLPGLEVSTTVPTTTATTAPPVVATTVAPVAETSPPQQAPAQVPQQQAPAQPPPTAPPLPSCGFGNGISVSGGNPATLGSGGGSFTVTSIPVTISVSGVPPCGKHYRLEYSGGGAKGSYNGLSACTFDGPSVTINSQFMSVGDTVSVTLQIPPNSCGD